MKIAYISPSELPSRSANSIHVLMQCDALAQISKDLVLYAQRSSIKSTQLRDDVREVYGVNLKNIRLFTFYSRYKRGNNLIIALFAVYDLLNSKWPDIVISRNLYASFIISVILRKPIMFETHQLELGIRKWIQYFVIKQKKTTTIVISNILATLLEEHQNVKPTKVIVLHDAAPSGCIPISKLNRYQSLINHVPQAKGDWLGVCGYFGHLYSGRGIEVIEKIAILRPKVLFLIFGGNDSELQQRRASNECSNIFYQGYVPYHEAQKIMRSVDILLMPYQKNVSIGIPGHDTARWMSPMKMFEYLASGVPIISSDLPVLREVLSNEINSLLVGPDNILEWALAIDKLLEDKDFAAKISSSGFRDYQNNHTWLMRAQKIITSGM